MTEVMLKKRPKLLQAAFVIETLAHMKGYEVELIPQAQFLRDLQTELFRVFNAVGDEAREAALTDLRILWEAK